MSMLDYNIFGSADSVDCDVMVFVDQLPPSIEQSKNLCKFYDEEIKKDLGTDKEVNSNLAIVRDGIITACFKGIPYETNNSIFLTYDFHEQKHDWKVKRLIPVTDEWIRQKAARAIRTILSFISRTQYRSEVKAALKGSTRQKIATLLAIDLETIEDFGKNNQNKADIYKEIAFQIGQATALLDKTELYTKQAIGKWYHVLRPFLYREENVIVKDLNEQKDYFLFMVMDYMFHNSILEYNLEHIKEEERI